MKLRFLHESKYFDQKAAQEKRLAKGQEVDIPDEDAGAFLAGDNPRAEVVKEKAGIEEEKKPKPEVMAKAAPVAEVKPAPKAVSKFTKASKKTKRK